VGLDVTGTVGGDLNQGGTYDGDQLTPGAVSGDLSLNLTGSGSNSNVETINAAPGSWQQFPVPSFAIQSDMDPNRWMGLSTAVAGDGTGAQITITRTTNVPTLHISDSEDDAGGVWTLDGLDYGQQTVTGFALGGHYDNCLLDYFGSSGDGSYSVTDTGTTAEAGSAAALHGSQTVKHEVAESATGHVYSPPVPAGDNGFTVDEGLTGSLTTTDTTRRGPRPRTGSRRRRTSRPGWGTRCRAG
jgi:hypothetical protein